MSTNRNGRKMTVKTVTARQAHAHLGEVLEDSQHEPVIIKKNGRPYSVVISVREFEQIPDLKHKGKVDELLATMREIGEKAQSRGLTPEIAQAIIDEK